MWYAEGITEEAKYLEIAKCLYPHEAILANLRRKEREEKANKIKKERENGVVS